MYNWIRYTIFCSGLFLLSFSVTSILIYSIYGKSTLGPAMDVILITFGGGLIILSYITSLIKMIKRKMAS